MIPALAAALLLSSCGGGDESSTSTASTANGLPPELVGTFAMTLKPSDVPPNPAPELTDQPDHWTLKITENDPVIGGPAFTIINDALGTLESSPVTVDGDELQLHNEECAGSPKRVESEYGWQRDSDELRFTEITNGCDDDVVLTLLTSEPWIAK
jgi:hypothetical protein